MRQLLRVITAAGVLVAAAPVLLFCARTMVAAWLVAPIPYPSPTSPTHDLTVIDRAAALAPGEALYAYYTAQEQRLLMRASWLDAGAAAAHGSAAAAAAARAIALVEVDPHFRLLAGSIDLERARLEDADTARRRALVASGMDALTGALALQEASPLLNEYAGLEMLRAWNDLSHEARRRTLATLRRASELHPEYVRANLSSLWLAAAPEELLTASRAVVPDNAAGQLALAAFLDARLLVDGRLPASAIRPLVIDAYAAAWRHADFDLGFLDRWMAALGRWTDPPIDRLLDEIAAISAAAPERPEVLLGAARAYALAGRGADRGVMLDRALNLSDGGGAAALRLRLLEERAAHRSSVGDFEGTLADLAEAIGLAPRDSRLRIRMGRVLDALGRPEEALERYREAIRIDPGSAAARNALAAAYAAELEYLDAIEQWRSILSRNPRASGPLLSIARAYAALGLFDQAIPFYTRVLEVEPNHADARHEMQALTRRIREPSP